MRPLLEQSNDLTTAIHDLRQPNDVRCLLLESDAPFLEGELVDLEPLFTSLVGNVGGKFEPDWEAIDFERARDSIELTLRFDMAYAGECMQEAEAADLTARFLENFEGGQAFVAAYELTDATFQVTFIAVAGTKAGILYLEDED